METSPSGNSRPHSKNVREKSQIVNPESEWTVVWGARMESRGRGLAWDGGWGVPQAPSCGAADFLEASALVFSVPHSPNYTNSPGTLSLHAVASAKGYVREHQNPSHILTESVFLNAQEKAADFTVSEMRTGVGLGGTRQSLTSAPSSLDPGGWM